MLYTTNYNLKKPDLTDNVKIQDINENTDSIDAQMKINATNIATVSEDLASHSADNVAHITAAERTNWNNKADSATVTSHTTDSLRHYGSILYLYNNAWGGF